MRRIFHYLYVEGALPSVKFLSQQRMAPCKVPHLRLLVLRNLKCKVCCLPTTQMNHSQSVEVVTGSLHWVRAVLRTWTTLCWTPDLQGTVIPKTTSVVLVLTFCVRCPLFSQTNGDSCPYMSEKFYHFFTLSKDFRWGCVVGSGPTS